MLTNILLNLYAELGHEIKNKKMYASCLIAIGLAFYYTYNDTQLFNKPLLLFTISMINIISTLYYAKTNSLFVTRIEVTDINLYFYIIMFILLYCMKAETITFLICVNTFFVIRAIKNFKFKFNKFEICKVVIAYSFCLGKFRLGLTDIVLYFYYAVAFTVIMHKSRNLQNFYRANYQINFLMTFSFGIYCIYDTDFYLSDFITAGNLVTISVVLLLGIIMIHMYVHMLTRFSLKTILFVQNEFILLLIMISCANLFMLLFMFGLVVVSFYMIDFDYGDKFYDPFDEVLVDNKTWNGFIKRILWFCRRNERVEGLLLEKSDDLED